MVTAQASVEQRRNGELEIWLPPLKSKEYVVAVDPAGGESDGDYSATQVLEMETGLQCAESVSYTHLDVYKRQVLLRPAWCCQPFQ